MRTARYLQGVLALALISIASPWLVAQVQPSQDKEAMPEQTETTERRQYTFAWQFSEDSDLAPRGGTSTGPSVELDQSVSPEFARMTNASPSTLERDRRAILAMAGNFRTSFDFIETVGFEANYKPARPYQSWGTEFVTVVENSEKFISLQHILVMRINLPSGEISDPFVMKHWRQDWVYEPTEMTEFVGNQTWATRRLPPSSADGQWLQSVYQVDDSPRYQAVGKWEHFENYSSWHSDTTFRPLPRREFSVRQDYNVLIGTNKHTINPHGWVQEEENLKVRLNDAGSREVLAKEVGLARYERIVGWDWSPGQRYWTETESFWAEARRQWKTALSKPGSLQIQKEVNGVPLYATMFELAQSTQESAPEIMSQKIAETIERHISRRN